MRFILGLFARVSVSFIREDSLKPAASPILEFACCQKNVRITRNANVEVNQSELQNNCVEKKLSITVNVYCLS